MNNTNDVIKTLNKEIRALANRPGGVELLPKLALGFAKHVSHLTDSKEALYYLEVTEKFIIGGITNGEFKNAINTSGYMADIIRSTMVDIYSIHTVNTAYYSSKRDKVDYTIFTAENSATVSYRGVHLCYSAAKEANEREWQLEFLRGLIKSN